MNSPRTFTGKTVDEATEDALAALGVELEDVEIRVLSPGRSGILGFGGEPAKIEVRLLGGRAAGRDIEEETDDDEEAVEAPPPPRREAPSRRTGRRTRDAREDGPRAEPAAQVPETETEEAAETPQRRTPRGRGGTTGGRQRDGAAARGGGRRSGGRTERREQAEERPAAVAPVAPEPADDFEEFDEEMPPSGPPRERDAEAEQLVAEILDYFLATMGVVAETYVRDELEDDSLVFEIEGEDAGLLIGRRGETLHALQFLVRMIVSRQLGRKAYVVIDVEDYRRRRADMLRRLARRTAGRVATSGRATALDPMPPGERRIVHMALASHPRVRTESEGEGNQRRVVVMPRR